MDNWKDVDRPSGCFDDAVHALPGIGEKRAAALAALGIITIGDLLFHFPRDYRDRSVIQSIADVSPGTVVTIEGEVTSARSLRLRGGKSMALLTVSDDTGAIKVTLFGRGFLVHNALKKGTRCLFTGTASEYKGLALQNPEYEPATSGDDADKLHTGRIVPVYPLADGITQRGIRRWIFDALKRLTGAPPETLPATVLKQHGFPDVATGLRHVHFPPDMQSGKQARNRFAYEELLLMQCCILKRRNACVETAVGIQHVADGRLLDRLRHMLPFTLTTGQRRAVDDILHDMSAPRPMFRLLQGDVGCGKTVVALHAVAVAVDTGNQVAFMAPTEILAEQHYATLHTLLKPLGVRMALLTGATPNAGKVRNAIAGGDIQVVIGTHALFQKQTVFQRLGLVIIDEQHRFGVAQRDALGRKGVTPDILHTTATPIPRTLAITLYGGMDISVIDDMPPGRKPVKTVLTPEDKRDDLYQYIRTQVAAGQQAYIVCPLVEESEHFAQLTPLIDHYTELTEGAFAGLRMELLHGRLDPREKETIMTRFKAREIDVLFATTVIEVGVDSPTATVMVIEDAGRFGLTQLHQLRGRVGRGTTQSWCFLLGKPTTPEGRQRLDTVCRCDNGFDIAEADMKLRGPGDYCGSRQSGMLDFRVADLLQDVRLLDAARRDAADIIEKDPELTAPEHQPIARGIQRFNDMFT